MTPRTWKSRDSLATHYSDPPRDISLLMEAASDLAKLTAQTAMRWYHKPIDVASKSDGTPVTIADREAEQAARDWLCNRFPGDGIIAEESPPVRVDAGRHWIVDPIDGTRTFVCGVPLWGSLVACCEGDRVLVGAVCCPVIGELAVAGESEGCWFNGSRSRVSEVSDISRATLLTTDERFSGNENRANKWRGISSRAAVSRTWGDCYGYLLVATGRAEVMVDGEMNPWDAAAVYSIVVEAGGEFTDWRGVRTAFGGDAIAGNSAMSREARRMLCTDSPA